MINLNDLYKFILNGELDKNNLTIVRNNSKIVDFLLPNEPKRNDEELETMTIASLLKEVFEY